MYLLERIGKKQAENRRRITVSPAAAARGHAKNTVLIKQNNYKRFTGGCQWNRKELLRFFPGIW